MRALVLILLVSVAVAGCASEAPPPEAPPQDDIATDDASTRELREVFTGSISGTPVAPGAKDFTLVVPQGAVGLNGSLSFSPALPGVGLTLLDPYGEVVDAGYTDADGNIVVATVEPPASGVWVYRVSSTTAVPVDFQLTATAELLVPQDNVVAKTLQMGPRSFYEVNIIMEANATFSFSFNASAPVAWDVHSHPPGGVKYWQEGTDASKAGEFTAPARGIYSLLFENTVELDNRVAFEMRGAFRLHSHAQ